MFDTVEAVYTGLLNEYMSDEGGMPRKEDLILMDKISDAIFTHMHS